MDPVAAARMPAADHPASPSAAAGAHPPAADRPPLDELTHLRKRVDQQEHTLAVMAEAISALRDGSQALRAENRELRLELLAAQRSSASADRSTQRTRDRQHAPAAPGPSEGERRTRAEIARRELTTPRHETRS